MNTLQANQQKKKPQFKAANDIELDNSLKSVPKAVAHEVTQASKDAVKDMWDSLLGANKYAKSETPTKQKLGGDLTPGQAVDLKGTQEKAKPQIKAEAPINYFREISEAGKANIYKEQQQIRQEVQSIIYELQRLAGASKQLQKDVAMAVGPSSAPAKMGKYHANFFEWMLIVVRDARKRVENAGAWLHTVKSKKKSVFGSMKKNMSQFMSGERSVSNQTA